MKTDKHNMDLEQMLADVEHAGRDARRQQELSAMIDHLAGEDSGVRHHGVWWWVSRVAAAACVLFFISTAVRIWFIPTESGVQMVAEAEVPEVVLPANVAPTVETTPLEAQTPRVRVKPVTEQPVVEEEQEAPIVVEEYLVEEIVEEELPVEETDEEPVDNQLEMIVQPMVSVAQTVEPAPVETAPAKSAKPVRRSLLSGLIRHAEPSKMDGTMLAFNIL